MENVDVVLRWRGDSLWPIRSWGISCSSFWTFSRGMKPVLTRSTAHPWYLPHALGPGFSPDRAPDWFSAWSDIVHVKGVFVLITPVLFTDPQGRRNKHFKLSMILSCLCPCANDHFYGYEKRIDLILCFLSLLWQNKVFLHIATNSSKWSFGSCFICHQVWSIISSIISISLKIFYFSLM